MLLLTARPGPLCANSARLAWPKATCAGLSLWLCACGDASLATVGLVDGTTRDAGHQRPDGSAQDGVDAAAGRASDAGRFDASLPNARDAGALGADCVPWIDQSTELGRAAVSGEIVARSSKESGCATSVEGEAGSSSIYARADGELLLHAGRTYSFRWTGINQFPKVRLHGGESRCSVEPIHQESATNFFSLPVPDGCSDFIAPFDARHVRLQTDWSVWLPSATPVVFELCEASCPAAP